MSNLNNLKVEKVYSVQELNNTVRDLIRSEFSQYVWVCGEIQDLRERLHVNLNLVQKDPNENSILAQVSAVIFANVKPYILKRIKESGSSFELKKDIEVKFLCKVDLYAKTGKFSLTVFDIDPVYTIGKVAQNRQKIIDEITKKGLLDKNKLKKIPAIPLKIGLITSSDSAAYHDFVNELNISGFGFKVFVYDAHMQGKNVEKNITSALKYFNNLKQDNLDLIVITRGGGSTADLGWFDNKKIAISIAGSNFAVVTALGHHINVTIADLVSHTSLKTPTKAAQFIINIISEASDYLFQVNDDILAEALDLIQGLSQGLETKTLQLDSFVSSYFKTYREEITQKRSLIINNVGHYIQAQNNRLIQDLKNLSTVLKSNFVNLSFNLKNIEDKIKILDPKIILKRGYSISIKGSKVIKSIKELKQEDKLKTVFFDGEAVSRVEKLNTDDHRRIYR